MQKKLLFLFSYWNIKYNIVNIADISIQINAVILNLVKAKKYVKKLVIKYSATNMHEPKTPVDTINIIMSNKTSFVVLPSPVPDCVIKIIVSIEVIVVALKAHDPITTFSVCSVYCSRFFSLSL